MTYDHRFPVIATAPDGHIRRPVHLVVGPGLTVDGEMTEGAAPVVVIWAWSAATGRAFPLLVSEAELIPVAGRSDRWSLATEEGTWQLRYSRSASCCGEPLRRFRPPGTGASRRSALR